MEPDSIICDKCYGYCLCSKCGDCFESPSLCPACDIMESNGFDLPNSDDCRWINDLFHSAVVKYDIDKFEKAFHELHKLINFKKDIERFGLVKLVRCVKNDCLFEENQTYFDLIVGQTYTLIIDNENKYDMVRVIDGSGESYCYPTDYFEEVSTKKKEKQMPTLWDILTKRKKEEQRLELSYYNPLQAKIGCVLTINETNYDNKNFIIQGIRVYERDINGDKFKFTDYEAISRNVNSDDLRIKVRLNPNDNGTELGCDVIVLTKFDELKYDEGFHKDVLGSDSGQFDITENDQTISFWRINDVLTAYNVQTIYLADKDGNGKVDPNEVKKEEISYWDFWRQTKETINDVEIDCLEFLFVEMDKNGFFTLWKGKKVNATNVVLF